MTFRMLVCHNKFNEIGEPQARKTYQKFRKLFTGYIKLKTFELSAVRLQPLMDKNRIDN